MADLKYWNIPAIDKGLNTMLGPEDIQPDEAAYVNGVRFGPGYFENRPGFQYFASAGVWPLSGTVRYLDTVTWTDGTATTIAVCACTNSYDKMYRVSGDSWVAVSIGIASHGWGSNIGVAVDSGYVGTGPLTDAFWKAENGHEAWFIGGAGGRVFKYCASYMATTSEATVLAGGLYDAATGSGYWNESTHVSRTIAMYDYQLWLAGVHESTGITGGRVRRSDVDNPHRYTTINYIDLIETEGAFVNAIAALGDNIVAYKSSSVTEIKPTGTPKTPYGKKVALYGAGVDAATAVSRNQTPHIFVTKSKKIVAYAGDGQHQIIGSKVTLNPPNGATWSSFGQVIAKWGSSGRYLYISFPLFSDKFYNRTTETGATRNHAMWIWDRWFDTWTYMEVPATCIGFSGGTTALTWDTIEGTWLEQEGTWADTFTGGATDNLIIADKDGYTYTLDENTVVDEDSRYPQDWMSEFEGAKWRPPVGDPPTSPRPGQLYRFQEISLNGTMQESVLTLETDEDAYSVEPDFSDDVWRHRGFDLRGEWLQMKITKAGSAVGRYRIGNISLGYLEDGIREAPA